jgi:hypothetical protein
LSVHAGLAVAFGDAQRNPPIRLTIETQPVGYAPRAADAWGAAIARR